MSLNFYGGSTVSDKRTLKVLQHKELVFIRCSLFQLGDMMGIPRLAEAWSCPLYGEMSMNISAGTIQGWLLFGVWLIVE